MHLPQFALCSVTVYSSFGKVGKDARILVCSCVHVTWSQLSTSLHLIGSFLPIYAIFPRCISLSFLTPHFLLLICSVILI
jgi:hypothetical protein